MENEKQREELPMGTIFKLSWYKGKTLMIIGHTCEYPDGNVYDYEFCEYPNGMGENTYSGCNNDEIGEVISLGYCNSEEDLNAANRFIKNHNVNVDQLGKTETYPNTSGVLTIGTILKAPDSEDMVMLAGYGGLDEHGIASDYICLSWPDGNEIGGFDHDKMFEDGWKVVSEGYVNEESVEYMRNMRQALDILKERHNGNNNRGFGRK